MPLLPEKLSNRGEVRGAVASQFWDQSVQSPKSLNGLVRTLPCEPPPLPQSTSSGLTRSQQMVAAQALDLPFTPAYAADEGGVVRAYRHTSHLRHASELLLHGHGLFSRPCQAIYQDHHSPMLSSMLKEAGLT